MAPRVEKLSPQALSLSYGIACHQLTGIRSIKNYKDHCLKIHFFDI
jgi:hypothetical protein